MHELAGHLGDSKLCAVVAGLPGATAAPYLLADYDPATFQEGGGAFQITGLRAAGAKGRLQTSFNLQLNGTVEDLTRAPLMVIYASGPVSETGQLQPHRGRVGDPHPVRA
jgi:hypothetical protein